LRSRGSKCLAREARIAIDIGRGIRRNPGNQLGSMLDVCSRKLAFARARIFASSGLEPSRRSEIVQPGV
jgi:hypothetical protein